jgi:hypothetical protein
MFGIPLAVPGTPAADVLPHGIRVVATTRSRGPVMRVPCFDPRPDVDAVFILVAVHIEPPPPSRGRHPDARVRWCCSPSAATVVGWTSADRLLHADIVKGEKSSDYVLRPDELEDPAGISEILKSPWLEAAVVPDMCLSASLRGPWEEVAASFLGVAPPPPCRECMLLNSRSEISPRSDVPGGEGWDEYVGEMSRMYVAVNTAADRHAAAFGELDDRRRRASLARDVEKVAKDEARLARILRKWMGGETVAPTHMRKLAEFRSRTGASFNEEAGRVLRGHPPTRRKTS